MTDGLKQMLIAVGGLALVSALTVALMPQRYFGGGRLVAAGTESTVAAAVTAMTAAIAAIESGEDEKLEEYLGPAVGKEIPEEITDRPFAHLIRAIRAGDAEAVGDLLEGGASPGPQIAAEAWLGSSLQTAAADGHTDIVALLLEHGADPDEWWECCTALSYAVEKSNVEMTRALLAAGAKLDEEYPALIGGKDLLTRAAELGAAEVVSLLLAEGLDPNGPQPLAEPVVLLIVGDAAAKSGFPAKKGGLLVKMSDPPLILAIEAGDADTCNVLLEAGALADVTSLVGASAIVLAARDNHAEIVTALIAAGADPNADHLSVTPLMWAMRNDNQAMAAALTQAGAELAGEF